jgi:hypothetical protein
MSEESIDNVSNDTAPKRDTKGRFTGSGNLRGRPKGSKAKHKHSKTTLENLLFKYGADSIKKIMTMANEALAKGDTTTAFKCLVFISGKYYELVVHNEKISIQEKQLKDKEVDEDDSSNNYTTVEFTPFKIA